MVSPVPGHGVSTPFGVRGPYWSCEEDRYGNGIHTGADYAAPVGTKVVAARPGVVRHVNYGAAFGDHQVAVMVGSNRDFYAHMATRVPDGTKVAAGDKVGTVGSEGNTSGPHLHFERHSVDSGPWSCAVITDPAPSIRWEDDEVNENDIAAIAARVNHTLGDYGSDGKPRDPKAKDPERANQRLNQIENVVRSIQDDVAKILKKLG